MTNVNPDDIKAGYTLGYADAQILRGAIKELNRLRESLSKPYGWVAEYPTVPAGIGGITYSFHDNRSDAQEEADDYNGHVVEVIRR